MLVSLKSSTLFLKFKQFKKTYAVKSQFPPPYVPVLPASVPEANSVASYLSLLLEMVCASLYVLFKHTYTPMVARCASSCILLSACLHMCWLQSHVSTHRADFFATTSCVILGMDPHLSHCSIDRH